MADSKKTSRGPSRQFLASRRQVIPAASTEMIADAGAAPVTRANPRRKPPACSPERNLDSRRELAAHGSEELLMPRCERREGINRAVPKEQAGDRKPKRRIRDMPTDFILRTPRLRRWYGRRLLKMMRKSREKGRRLAGNLAIIERQLRPLPPARQEQMLQQILEGEAASKKLPPSREMRRASGRAERKGTRGKGVRPGLAPGQRRRA